MDINEIKKEEMQEIIEFYYHIKDYGHIFHLDSELLKEPFRKIIEGIEEIKEMIDKSFNI